MSLHLEAKPTEIAPVVLLPGDPLRARFIAQTFLTDAVQVNQVRNALGFTGLFQGRRVTVQSTGMGMPSLSIYAHELLRDYGVRVLLRVGTCGALQQKVRVRDLVVAMSASTDSAMNHHAFGGMAYAPTADFELLFRCRRAMERQPAGTANAWFGNVLTSDSFYGDDPRRFEAWVRHGVLATEMETAALYTLAARFGARALSLLTVSDHVLTGEHTSAEERQLTFRQMIELALEVGTGPGLQDG